MAGTLTSTTPTTGSIKTAGGLGVAENVNIGGKLTVSVDGAGTDVKFYGNTSSYYVWFDANADTNGTWFFGADTTGIKVALYGDTTGCGVFWDPSTDTNGTLAVGASGGSKGNDVLFYGNTNSSYLKWDQGSDTLLLAAAPLSLTGSIATGISLTGAYATAGISVVTTLAAYGDYALYVQTTGGATSGTQRQSAFIGTMTGAGALGRVLFVDLTIDDVEAGAYVNAFKAQLDFATSGSVVGLASVACLEFVSPGASTAAGTYTILELEMVASANFTTGRPLNYIWAGLTGDSTAKDAIDADINVITLDGHTDASGNMWYDNTLRIRLDAAEWYIPLSTVEGTFTTAYPIVSTYSSGACITVTNTATASGYYGLYANSTFSYATSGVHKAILGKTTYSPASSGYGTSIGVVGQVVLTAGKTFSGGQGAMYGVQGQLDLPSTAILDNSSSVFAALRAVITGAPTCTNFSLVAGLYIDTLNTGNITGGEYGSAMIAMAVNGAGSIDTAILIKSGATLTNFLNIQGTPSFMAGDVKETTGVYSLRVKIGENDYWINCYLN